MNRPHFETYPQHDDEEQGVQPNGQFGWRFQDANGRLTFIGGEGFDSRSNARRAIHGAASDVAQLVVDALPAEVVPDVGQLHAAIEELPIVDLDAAGNDVTLRETD